MKTRAIRAWNTTWADTAAVCAAFLRTQSITAFYDGRTHCTHSWVRKEPQQPRAQFAGVSTHQNHQNHQNPVLVADKGPGNGRAAFGICFWRYLDRNRSLWHRSRLCLDGLVWTSLKSGATSLPRFTHRLSIHSQKTQIGRYRLEGCRESSNYRSYRYICNFSRFPKIIQWMVIRWPKICFFGI